MSLVQDELRPEIHLSRLGDMEVTCVLDGRAVRPGLTPSHGGELLANDVRKLAEANGIDPNLYEVVEGLKGRPQIKPSGRSASNSRSFSSTSGRNDEMT